ncbi:hypothetical protein CEXT_335731 [Caerostris extrusa]|uniref:Uncharacterized protein n=1 Tax=Caerostris extrusa TaxID=172846 RepID=A0AAV4R203_CAEEX|nr:hypothetical protein CEXT_335731 [Caerostris extrusa]
MHPKSFSRKESFGSKSMPPSKHGALFHEGLHKHRTSHSAAVTSEEVYFLWRPTGRNQREELCLEIAVANQWIHLFLSIAAEMLRLRNEEHLNSPMGKHLNTANGAPSCWNIKFGFKE